MTARLAQSFVVRLAIFTLLATILVWPTLELAGWSNEFRDAQVLMLHERAAVTTVTHFGELPLWDPYYCGGLYGLGAPQSRFLSPTFLASILLGAQRAEPIVVLLFTVAGMEGMYRWLRLRITDATAALRVAPLFALSGHFAVAFFRGWTNFYGFELLPFVLFGITLASRGRVAGLATAAIAFTLLLAFGGAYAAPLVAVACTIEAIRAFLEAPPRQRARAAAMLLATALFMATVSAIRLWPLAETLASAPRIMAGTPGHGPKAIWTFLVSALTVKDGNVTKEGAFYVGGAFIALVALGGADRKSLRSVVVVILMLWLAAGYSRKPALFASLRALPLFSALRYPERFLWLAIVFASEPVARALTHFPLLGDGKRWRLFAHVGLTGAVLFTIATEIHGFARVAKQRELGVVADAPMGDFRQTRGNRWLAAHYDGIRAGSLSCWETHPVLQSPLLRADLPAEEYLADETAGAVKRTAWSPNHLSVHASLTKPARLLVNQNWHPGWRSSVGTAVSEDNLLAVDLPAGDHDVLLSFRPLSARGGAIVSATALAALLLLGIRSRRGKRAFSRGTWATSALLVAAPWVAFAVSFATSSEARFAPPPQRNANGKPALISAVPPELAPMHPKFALPIAVEGMRMTGPDGYGNVHMELVLRRTGELDRETAMFVHLERRDGQSPLEEKQERFFNADHQVVGGTFFLADMPLDALVYDAFGENVSKGGPGVWDVWLAFGHASGRRGRIAVTDAGGAEVSESRVRLGTFELR